MNRRGWMASLGALVAGLPFARAEDDTRVRWPDAITYYSIDGTTPTRLVYDPYCPAGWVCTYSEIAFAGTEIMTRIRSLRGPDTTVMLPGGRVIPAWSLGSAG